MKFYLTESSRNQKTGPIPVATISMKSCPSSCPLKDGGGCYAEQGPLAFHWKKVTDGERGDDFPDFLKKVRNLPDSIWRYGQAGDLPGEGDRIDRDQLLDLARANRNRPVIAFTHKPPTKENMEALYEANNLGFHVNLSADSPEEADELAQHGMSVVTVLPSEYHKTRQESLTEYRERLKNLPKTTPEGRRLAVCPATYTETTCHKCRACSYSRNAIIAFPAHGSRSKKIDSLFQGGPLHETGGEGNHNPKT